MCSYTRLRRLRLRFPAPRYRNSLTFHCPFIILRRSCHVFRPYCLSCVDIQKFLQETRPRTTFTELRDRDLATKIL